MFGFITKIRQFISAHKNLSILAILVLAALIGGWQFFAGQKQQPQYQTETAQRGTLVTTVTASGNISAGTSASITTSATGIVSTVYVKAGDTVTAGQKIADITPDTDSQQRQAAAWASYLSAQNTLAAAQAKMNSLQATLFTANQAFINDKGTINPDTSDPKYIEENATWLQAEADYKNQTGVIAQAQAAVSSAWLAYSQLSSTVTAPVAGTITNFNLTEGMSITNSGGSSSQNPSASPSQSSSTLLGTITLPNGQVQAAVNLSEIDVPKVQVGQKATLTLDAFPNQTFTGKIAAINTNGVVSSGVTTYPATIILDTSQSTMYPNMAVNANIIIQVKDNVLLVPSTAVQTINGQTMVRVLKNGQVQEVQVTVGDSNDTQTEITSGLNEGDTVVTSVITPTSGNRATSSPFSGTGGGFGIFRGGGGGGGVRTGRGG